MKCPRDETFKLLILLQLKVSIFLEKFKFVWDKTLKDLKSINLYLMMHGYSLWNSLIILKIHKVEIIYCTQCQNFLSNCKIRIVNNNYVKIFTTLQIYSIYSSTLNPVFVCLFFLNTRNLYLNPSGRMTSQSRYEFFVLNGKTYMRIFWYSSGFNSNMF